MERRGESERQRVVVGGLGCTIAVCDAPIDAEPCTVSKREERSMLQMRADSYSYASECSRPRKRVMDSWWPGEIMLDGSWRLRSRRQR